MEFIIQIGSVIIPILIAGFGAYINIREDIAVLKTDVDNLAFLIGTNKSKGRGLITKTKKKEN